ncbi:MAG: dienelactone hydrolase family protein [Bacteroidota bacterium]
MRSMAILAFLLLSITTSLASLKSEEVTYKADGLTMKGWLVYDDAVKGKRPGVLVVHEWWGHNEYARTRAKMLAEMGYTALAVDMFGNGKTAKHPDDAGKFASEAGGKLPVAKARFLAGWELLRKHETVDAANIAAIGYCFGGGVVLNMARAGVDLKGVVSFHGMLGTGTPAKAGEVKGKVLVCHGADDSFIPKEQIEAFKKEMKDAKVDMTFKSYPNAKHGFTNPAADKAGKEFGIPIAYNEKADKDSWKDMTEFLKKILKKS